MRKYRKTIIESGQYSPEYLNKYVRDVIDSIKEKINLNVIGDIGCGLGFHSIIFKKYYPTCKFIGIDFSKATIDYIKNKNIFNEVYWVNSETLPIKDKSTDIAISMENLEHLYYEEVINAIKELKRTSSYIIITTPVPSRVINNTWLNKELKEAVKDTIPLTENDYYSLESCIHKSVVFPESLIDAGFQQIKKYGTESECYYGESDNINISKIKLIGIKKCDIIKNCEFKNKYIDLLNRSLALNYAITQNS